MRFSVIKVSSKGHIMIPEEIRLDLELRAGDQFIVVAKNSQIILKRLTKPSLEEISGPQELQLNGKERGDLGVVNHAYSKSQY